MAQTQAEVHKSFTSHSDVVKKSADELYLEAVTSKYERGVWTTHLISNLIYVLDRQGLFCINANPEPIEEFVEFCSKLRKIMESELEIIAEELKVEK